MMLYHNIPLKIKATDKTPQFEYSPKSGIFSIVGVSIPERPEIYYVPIIKWVQEYVMQQNKDSYLIIKLDLDYFSTQSLMYLVKILKPFQPFNNIIINWYYEDEDLLECGQELATMIKIPFNFICKFS